MTTAIEKFLLVGTQESYNNLETPDENMLYFCSDTGNIYKGSKLYTDAIRKVTVRPTIPAVGKLYFISSTSTIEFYDGTNWNILTNPDQMCVNITKNEDGTYSSDMNYYDIVAALNNGLNVFCLYNEDGYTTKYTFNYLSDLEGAIFDNILVNSTKISLDRFGLFMSGNITRFSSSFTVGDILLNSINSTLKTTNKTIIGAINELKSEIDGLVDIGEVEF